MPASPKVLAICVNWNGGELLQETLRSLQASRYSDLQVLVVDCASTDQSVDDLPAGVKLLRLSENLGYGAALNRALEHADNGAESEFSYFLLLNNDIRLAEDCVEILVQAAERRNDCICGPRILQWRKPDRLEASWGELRWHHVLADFLDADLPETEAAETSREVELLLGCALLMSRRTARRIGSWDEHFFLYHEEIDYLYRAAREGIPVIYVPRAKAYHWGGWGSTDSLQKVFWLRRNTVYFLRKHRATNAVWMRWGATLGASLIWNVLLFRWRRAGMIWRGVASGLRMESSRG